MSDASARLISEAPQEKLEITKGISAVTNVPEKNRGLEDDGLAINDIAEAQRQNRREQQRRFQEYISEADPQLAASITEEAVRFAIVSRSVIEPTMQEFAEKVRLRGWWVSIVRDDDLDRLALFATPGIRFYCSRRPSHDSNGQPLWPPCFVGFFGSARHRAVGTVVELSWAADETASSFEPLLEYPDVTDETVRAVLIAFLEDMTRLC